MLVHMYGWVRNDYRPRAHTTSLTSARGPQHNIKDPKTSTVNIQIIKSIWMTDLTILQLESPVTVIILASSH